MIHHTKSEYMPTYSKGHGTVVGHPRSAVDRILDGRDPACHVRRRERGGYPGYVPAVRALRAGEADGAEGRAQIDRDAAGVDRLEVPGHIARPVFQQVTTFAQHDGAGVHEPRARSEERRVGKEGTTREE